MSPRMGSSPDEERFDDPAHDEIRALLGDARVTEPTPAEVVSRLDDVLAGLRPEAAVTEHPVAEHPVAGRPSNVVPLRRRWAPRLLAAAAVVVVAGGAAVGVGQVVQQDRSADSATAEQDSGGVTTQDSEQSAPERADAPTPRDAALDRLPAAQALPNLTAADFADTARTLSRQVLELRKTDGLEESYSFGSPSAPTPSAGLDASPQSAEPQALSDLLTDRRGATAKRLAELCAGPAGSEATKVRVRFEGELAVLLFGQVADGEQPVSAWTCDGSRLLAQTTVPVS